MKENQVSKTAAYLAIKFYGLTLIPRYRDLFEQSVLQYYESLIQFLPPPLNWYHPFLKNKAVRAFFIGLEECLLPGDLLHVVARKWYMQQLTTKLLDQEYEQILILGAGFDHLGHYFSQKGILCSEIDAPATAKAKHHFLEKTYTGKSYPHIVPADMQQNSLANLLHQQPQINPHKKTIIIAEGFFAYLTYHNVASVFITLNDYFSHKTAIVSTHFSLDELPKRHRWVYKTSVKSVGEKLQFQTTFSGFSRLLSTHGFKIRQVLDRQNISSNMKRKTNTSLSLLNGFYILLIQ